jgi:hypothetical protein
VDAPLSPFTPHSALGTPPSLASLRRGTTLARLWLGFRLSLLPLDPLGAKVYPPWPACRFPRALFEPAAEAAGHVPHHRPPAHAVTPSERSESRGLALNPLAFHSAFRVPRSALIPGISPRIRCRLASAFQSPIRNRKCRPSVPQSLSYSVPHSPSAFSASSPCKKGALWAALKSRCSQGVPRCETSSF